ncbi:aminotransferase class I/II-fold pyridoxal phosphate-dependent enzyme [Streptomyces lavendulocolor]|uniref:Aminotransferase class I/II-fold pyridoxal phosphate-dependent enzyme n=1 Tax=Streptomyces lavendulocolor TaxID=67316 RepID=A0ABV2W955_9ACTN
MSVHRLMVVYLLVVAPFTVVHLTVPERHTSSWAVIGLAGVVAILVGIRVHRPARRWPWLMLAAANLTFTAGDTTYNTLESVFGLTNPFPSLADVFSLSTYPLFAAGFFGFIRYRTQARDLASLLDALILTAGLALLSWVHLINPLTMAGDTWSQRAVAIAYPLGDVLILAMTVRLLTLGGLRERAVQLLALGTCGILTSDVLHGLLQLQGTWRVGTYMDLGWVVFFTAWGLAALHPSMVRLTERAPQPAPGLAKRRLAVLACASMIAPVMLLVEALLGTVRDAAVIAVFSALMFLLVMARLWELVSEHRRAVTRERSLRVAAASLVGAVTPSDVARCVETAATTLFGPGVRHEAVLLSVGADRRLRPMAPSGRPWRLGIDIPADVLAPPAPPGEPGPRPVPAPTAGEPRAGAPPPGAPLPGAPPPGEPAPRTLAPEAPPAGQPRPEAPPAGEPPADRTTLVPDARPEAAGGRPGEPPGVTSGGAPGGLSGGPAAGHVPGGPCDGTRLLDAAVLGPEAAAALGPATRVVLSPLTLEDPQAGHPLIGALLVAGPRRRLERLGASVESLASQAALALERVGLSEEINRRRSEAYFRTLVHNASDVILIVDDDGTVRYASPSARGMFGGALLGGTPLTRLVSAKDRARAARTLRRVRADEVRDVHDDWRMLRSDDQRLDVEVRCNNLRDEQTVHGIVLTLRDVTAQRELERELTHRAFHDALTGLPNRVLLLERIERALLRGRRDVTLTGVLFVDLDDFKVVNDMMGHSVGDELLVAVARRLTAALRRTDTAARIGGDEFAVLMEGAREPEDAERLAAQVVRALDEPFRLTTGSTSVSACVGVATAHDSDEAEELLGHADLALYAAKTAGKGQWQRYRPDLHAGMVERHALQAGLDSAIDEQAFALRYQPIVEIDGGAVAGYEALIRWPRQRGVVPPDQFIGLAEETGHIMPLGAWVLERAAGDVAGWQRDHPRNVPLHLNVNVSARQFIDPGFVEDVRRVLDTSGLARGSLVLEITESVLMRRDEQIRAAMRTLKRLGVSIAIDDFGTGFSSLSYLREFPIDVLKVDKSFIDDIITDGQQVALVEGIVRIADVLGLQVIAEGIENAGQRDLLAAMGCRFGQGYLFARPMTADEARGFLHDSGERQAAPLTGVRGAHRTVAHPAARGEQRLGDLRRLQKSSRMCDAVIDEVHGRRIRCGDHWLADFASSNYLGFDFDPEIMDAIGPHVRRWGTHPGWSRFIGNPRLYSDIEERLAGLLGAPDTLLLPTVTLIHSSVIPVLAAGGQVCVEARAHRTVYDGCMVARGQGASVRRFHGDRPDELEQLLAAAPPGAARLVCVDGVDSMTGNLPDLSRLATVCRAHEALLYIDDAHGFGVIGERGPAESSPYGSRGNSIVRHLAESYEGVVLVGGFSKAYSSLLAFVTAPPDLKEHLKVAAGPYLYSGPSPTASLATVLAGLDVNDRRGDAIRADLYDRTRRVLDHVRALGIATPSTDGLPIVEIPLADSWDLDAVGDFLWDHGIYVTLAGHPLVPRKQVGFRVQVTALNTDEEIEQLLHTLTELADRFPLQQRLPDAGPAERPQP